jgi:uncharacterized caspase-like protein
MARLARLAQTPPCAAAELPAPPLTASGPDESAQESSDFGHGVFTYFLLEGLDGAANITR